MKSNVQVCNEKARALYCVDGVPPLLQQICIIHQITIREFAGIFGISKAHAENLMKHRVFPTMELGLDICRYFECTVEDLFGWRVDDHGKRRPLIAVDQKTNQAYRLLNGPEDETMKLVRQSIKERLAPKG